MQDVFIVASKRTPVGAFMGSLAGVSAIELGATALKAAMAQAGVPFDRIQELYYGSVLQANLGTGHTSGAESRPAQHFAVYIGEQSMRQRHQSHHAGRNDHPPRRR
jgi:acetyl-CoA acetyltransferase